MPQDQRLGTARDRRLCDYAYTRKLSALGWAWEFLRRNVDYQGDVGLNRAERPSVIQHESGATLYKLLRRSIAAEKWGLSFFADPNKSALQVVPFWLQELISDIAFCEAKVVNDNDIESLSLGSFAGRRAVLDNGKHEIVSIQQGVVSAYLVVTEGSLVKGKDCILKFYHQGFKSAASHFETLKILLQLTREIAPYEPSNTLSDSKYRDYLVALDGRLAGRSYRDIAEVLYGSERVGEYWTDDTRGLKSKVRRAVESGLALMNGGYRDLL